MTDLRYALRSVRNSPGFATVVIVTLAIGIGANTAIVSLLHTVLVRELPVTDPQKLLFIQTAGDRGLGIAPPYPYFERIREQGPSFSGMAAFNADELRVDVDGSVEQVFGQVVSGNYFQVLGVTPATGRECGRESDDAAADDREVVGHRGLNPIARFTRERKRQIGVRPGINSRRGKSWRATTDGEMKAAR